MKNSLPATLSFSNHYEIIYRRNILRRVAPELEIEEIGHVGRWHYIALIYIDKNSEYDRMKEETLTRINKIRNY